MSWRQDPDLLQARDALLRRLGEWLKRAVATHAPVQWQGVHDEGTFLTAWREYYLLTHDPAVPEFAAQMLAHANTWFQAHLPDGYFPRQEVHHGVEHFIIFLAWLLELDPTLPGLAAALRRGAHHILRPCGKRAPWYDGDATRFRSMFLGANKMGREGLNIPEHLRLVRLGYLAYAAGADSPFYNSMEHYARVWAKQIIENEFVPVVLDEALDQRRGARLFQRALKKFIGAAPKKLTPWSRCEYQIANGTPGLFFSLYDRQQDPVFLRAAARIVTELERQCQGLYAHPLPELVWKLEQYNPGSGLLDPVREAYEAFQAPTELRVSLRKVNWKEPAYQHLQGTVGMRSDMPEVVVDTEGGLSPWRWSPGYLGLMTRVTGDPVPLTVGLQIAEKVLSAYEADFPDGRGHGCSARTIAAAVIGHGRNWGSGFVSAALRPLLDGADIGVALPDPAAVRPSLGFDRT